MLLFGEQKLEPENNIYLQFLANISYMKENHSRNVQVLLQAKSPCTNTFHILTTVFMVPGNIGRIGSW